jgi:hypothetical protein
MKKLTVAGTYEVPVPLHILVRSVEENQLSIQEAWLALCISYQKHFRGTPHPTNGQLAEMMNMTVRQVRRLMLKLEEKSVANRTGENREEMDLNPVLDWRG